MKIGKYMRQSFLHAIVRDMYSAKVSEENQGAWCIYEKYNTHVYIHIRDHIGLVI